MNFNIALDKYLTAEPPDDGFTDYCEITSESLPNEFYEKNENWVMEHRGLCDKWLNKCFNKDIEPKKAAKLIERAFYLYHI